MSTEHEQIMKALAKVQDAADSAASYASEEKVPLEIRDALDYLCQEMQETLKRLDNIERHMGIVPHEELEDD